MMLSIADTPESRDTRSFGGLMFVSILLLVGVIGCTPMIREPGPQLSGTFSGTTHDGHAMSVTFDQQDNAITGRGILDGRNFGLSGLISWHGPIVLNFGDGGTRTAYVTLSADGNSTTLRGLGAPVTLDRGGDRISVPSGPFAGRFATGGPIRFWLTLTQGSELLAGTGYIDGKPVAVVGKVTGANRARGSILFQDESQNRVTVNLSADGRILTVEGLGAPVEMTRQ